MDAITLSVEIGEDRHLDIQLPNDVPVGPAELVVKPREEHAHVNTNPAREAARAKLQAGGALSVAHRSPEGAKPLTPEERDQVWQLFSQGRSSDELINEDRGSY